MTKQFDVFSMSGALVARVTVEETTLVRDILQQISDVNGTPKRNMSLVCSWDLEASNGVCQEDTCLGKQCFAAEAGASLTVVVLDVDDKEPSEHEVAPAPKLEFRQVVKKLTPCVRTWAETAFAAVASLSVFGGVMTAFVGFIMCCVAMGSVNGPTLFEKICFGIFTSTASISLICSVAWSTHKAISQGKFRESLQNCVGIVIKGLVSLSILGVATTACVGFIICCIAMGTVNGPDLFEKICFGIFTSTTSISLICLVVRSARKAISQGKFRQGLQNCVGVAIKGLVSLSVLGVAMTVFVGFIMCCGAMGRVNGPTLFEKICFGIFTSTASISLICSVAWSTHKAISEGRIRESLQNCVGVVIKLMAFFIVFGVATTACVGFIMCCIAMGTVNGPNLFEEICFAVSVLGATFACCGFACMQIRDALKS